MGRNNRQRRAAHQRRSAHQRPPDTGPRVDTAAIDRLLIDAAMLVSARDGSKDVFERAVMVLVDLQTRPASVAPQPIRPIEAMAALLQRSVASAFEYGWQPADLAHLIRREHTQRAQRLVRALIAEESRRQDAPARAPQLWLAQLEDLGVFDPARMIVIGGQPAGVAAWARAEKLDPDEVLTGALHVLSALLQARRLSVLVPPPSAWGATNRGSFSDSAGASGARRARLGEVDAKALKLIRALLAKAEATNFEAEADAFTAKAQEMMTRHSIDAAVLDAASHGGAAAAVGVESRRVHIDNPYAEEKASLLSIIADVNGAKCVWSPNAGFSTVMGFSVDLRLTDLLFTSLLLQATRAAADATSLRRDLRTPSYRRAFLIAFGHRIGERLEATRTRAAEHAEQHYGSALVPILADREAAVDAAYATAFPDVSTMRSRRVNASGYHAGRAAADRAHIGAGEAISGT